jgi:hypothetical protein
MKEIKNKLQNASFKQRKIIIHLWFALLQVSNFIHNL